MSATAVTLVACDGGDPVLEDSPSPNATAAPTTPPAATEPSPTPPVEPTFEEFALPAGSRPHDVAPAPDGTVWYVAQAGGARRVWSDSAGRLWVTAWFAGRLARFDPTQERWSEWDLPGDDPRPYAVFVDDRDVVWVTDFGANALVGFDPATETFRSFAFPSADAQVRQLLGRPGEVWGVGSATDTAIVLRTG